MKILLAVDGSKPSLDAVGCLIQHADWYREAPVVELVTVQPPLPQIPGLASLGRSQIRKYYQDEGETRLAAAKKKLDAARIAYRAHVLVGAVAESLVKHAKTAGCDLICMGCRGMTGIAGVLLGSTATRVLNLTTLPVLLVK